MTSGIYGIGAMALSLSYGASTDEGERARNSCLRLLSRLPEKFTLVNLAGFALFLTLHRAQQLHVCIAE